MSVALNPSSERMPETALGFVAPNSSTTDVYLGIERHKPIIGWNENANDMPAGTTIAVYLEQDKVTIQYTGEDRNAHFKELDHKVFYDHLVDFLKKLRDCDGRPK